jgi:hypothetical protein
MSQDVTLETERRDKRIDELNSLVTALESEKREITEQLAEREKHIHIQNEYISN